MKWTLIIFLLVLLVGAGVAIYKIFSISQVAIPSFEEVKKSYKRSDAVLLDRNGNVIDEIRVDPKVRRCNWISLRDISPALIKNVINLEDKRFKSHKGVDFLALSSSFFHNLFSSKKRGGSTVSMQLVSFLDEGIRVKKGRRSFSQKFIQIREAFEIEKFWTKNEILEGYLNLAGFRGELQGIAAVSEGLFGKIPSGLNEIESLILAAVLNSPNASLDRISRRSCSLSRLVNPTSRGWIDQTSKSLVNQTFGSLVNGLTNCDEIKILVMKELGGTYRMPLKFHFAPHVAQKLLSNQKLIVKSTLDGDLQRFSHELLKNYIISLKNQNVNDGAILVADNKSGDVLAYVGNASEDENVRFVDGVVAKRQAGSTLKPFLYGLALDKRIITAASRLSDTPIDIHTERGIYEPKNYDNQYRGLVSAREALASSINIPAVRVLNLVGEDPFVQKLRELGFSNLEGGEYYGLSLALGTADVSLWELTNAYRSLSNFGVWGELRMTFENTATTPKKVFSKEATFIVTDVISDREARSSTFSLENPLGTRYFTAVKTGTSKDMRDNWCIGFSQKYTVGVWVGNLTGEPMWNVSGVTGAAPIWLELMNYLHKDFKSVKPKPPKGVILSDVNFQELDVSKKEWFILGTEPSLTETKLSKGKVKIIYPVNKTTFAIDPSIPSGRQKLYFEFNEESHDFSWMLDGNLIGIENLHLWTPIGGKHKLALLNKQNEIVDEIVFDVKD